MLFFSSDETEVVELAREFTEAGIPCDVRQLPCEVEGYPQQAEVWVCDDCDSHRALMLCVQRNIGFARRPRRKPALELEYVLEDLPEGES